MERKEDERNRSLIIDILSLVIDNEKNIKKNYEIKKWDWRIRRGWEEWKFLRRRRRNLNEKRRSKK